MRTLNPDQAAAYRTAFIYATRTVTSVYSTVLQGHEVVVRYRPSVALAAGSRDRSGTPAADAVEFVSDLVATFEVDGKPVSVGHGPEGLTLGALQVIMAVVPALIRDAEKWAVQQCQSGSPAAIRAAHAALRQ